MVLQKLYSSGGIMQAERRTVRIECRLQGVYQNCIEKAIDRL